MTDTITVLVADVSPVVREGVSTIFACHAGLAVVARAASGDEALALWRRTRPAVTLLDLQLPDGDGIDVIAALRAENPEARIIVFTDQVATDDVIRAMVAGARGYILKNATGRQLIEAVQAVHAGEQYLPAVLEARLTESLSSAAGAGSVGVA